MDRELHSNAHGGDENDHWDGTELDANQTHDSKQLHSHHGQDEDLQRMKRSKRRHVLVTVCWVVCTDVESGSFF